MSESFDEFLTRRLKEALGEHTDCPTCGGMLAAVDGDITRPWCPLCGYERDTTRRGEGWESMGRTDPPNYEGIGRTKP